MYLQTGSKIFNLLGGRAAAKKAYEMIKNYMGSGVQVISKPTTAQKKAATELSSSRSQAVQTLRKVGEEAQGQRNIKYWDKIKNPPKQTKGIKKQSGETGEGLTEAQKAARSRASQQRFLKAEKPARKRQEGIQSAREKRRWAERDAERNKGGQVGNKKSSSKHVSGSEYVALSYD